MADLVTGEAVVLELRLARFASRGLALAVDLAAQLVLLTGGTLALGGVGDTLDTAATAALGLVLYVSVVVGYPVAVETLSRGRSLGKLALGLRVVRDDGGPQRFRQALVRGLLGVVEIWATFGSVALIVSLASRQGKRVGDYLAGTVVVLERVPVPAAAAAAMPPQLAGWAQTLDLSRVPDGLALDGRRLLGRAGELAPEVRDRMAAELAAAFAAVTAPPPPAGVPPAAFLAAVLAERRRREMLRLAGAQPAAAPPYVSPPRPGAAPPDPGAAPPDPGAAPPGPGRDAGHPFAPPS